MPIDELHRVHALVDTDFGGPLVVGLREGGGGGGGRRVEYNQYLHVHKLCPTERAPLE